MKTLAHCGSITLDALCCLWHNACDRVVELLAEHGPSLPFPYSSGIATSRHRHMRELRVQHEGRLYRVLYAFDPRRAAILLLAETRPETIDGTRSTFLSPITCTTSTSRNWNERG